MESFTIENILREPYHSKSLLTSEQSRDLSDYSFTVAILNARDKKASKYTSTYSSSTNVLFIKQSEPVFSFTFQHSPPPLHSAFIEVRVLPKLGSGLERIESCLRHSSNGLKHFVRSPSSGVSYHEYADSSLSLRLPIQLLKISENSLEACLEFPCYTSDIGLSRHVRKGVEVQFSLKHNEIVLHSVSFDMRVCSVPGRDRKKFEDEHDQLKGSLPAFQSVNTKRLADWGCCQTDWQTGHAAPLPLVESGRVMDHGLKAKRKRVYSTETYSELFPIVDKLVQSMEMIYEMRV